MPAQLISGKYFETEKFFAETKELSRQLIQSNSIQRIWKADGRLWSEDASKSTEIGKHLEWLTIIEQMDSNSPDIEKYANEFLRSFKNIVVLGVGGSSVAKQIYFNLFDNSNNYSKIEFLDSIIPSTILDVDSRIDLPNTLFIVISKKGTTLETDALFKYYWEKVSLIKKEKTGENFVAITTANTYLEKLAKHRKFRKIFLDHPNLAGRIKALTVTGLLPAALLEIDISSLILEANKMLQRCKTNRNLSENPGVTLATKLLYLDKNGFDKLTIMCSPSLLGLGYWIEQITAEWLCKDGKGLIPLTDEPIFRQSSLQEMGNDRCFVYVYFDHENEKEKIAEALESAGMPLIRICLKDKVEIASEVIRWAFAYLIFCLMGKIDPFNEPDLEDGFLKVKNMLASDSSSLTKILHHSESQIYETLESILKDLSTNEYLGLQAFLPYNKINFDTIQLIRKEIFQTLGVATSLGFAPQFLHSTGQLHKGGKNIGSFIQIICAFEELLIPSSDYSFNQILYTEAIGDALALKSRGRKISSIYFHSDVELHLKLMHKYVKEICNKIKLGK